MNALTNNINCSNSNFRFYWGTADLYWARALVKRVCRRPWTSKHEPDVRDSKSKKGVFNRVLLPIFIVFTRVEKTEMKICLCHVHARVSIFGTLGRVGTLSQLGFIPLLVPQTMTNTFMFNALFAVFIREVKSFFSRLMCSHLLTNEWIKPHRLRTVWICILFL